MSTVLGSNVNVSLELSSFLESRLATTFLWKYNRIRKQLLNLISEGKKLFNATNE